MTVLKTLPTDPIDNLLAGYQKPEDLIWENGLLKQLTKTVRSKQRCRFPIADFLLRLRKPRPLGVEH